MCDTRIINNAETLVCEAVNKAFEALRPGAARVTADGLYDKKGNVPLPVATARHFCFRLLHDVYGFPYSAIAQRAGMNAASVIKKVRKVRSMMFTDEIYKAVASFIDEELKINN